MRRAARIWIALAVAVLAGSQAWAAARIVARPLSPQEVTDYRLPATTQRSAGLLTVGVGTPAYLEVQVEEAAVVTGSVTWSLTAPSGGTATLQTSPLAIATVPIYTPGERELYKLADRRLLIPNAQGQWQVTAQFSQQTAAGADSAVTVQQVVTAATYVGAASCVGCHQTDPPFTGTEPGPGDSTQWAHTPHATMFTRSIDGANGTYRATCVGCHTVGYDSTATAANGGFDDVARQLNWTFPAVIQPGNWAAIPAQLQAKANIQCENCHGPGNQHNGNVADNRISVSLNAGSCAVCHDSGTHHFRPREWESSLHAAALDESGPTRGTCAICHSGAGFVERLEKGLDITQTDYATKVTETSYEAISCQTCHDPHVEGEEHPMQLRTVADVQLITGQTVSRGGTGKLCMNCHKARRGGEEYAATYHSRHDPHGSPQTDMLVGTGAAEYGGSIRRSTHLYAVENACVGCHMQPLATTEAGFTYAGGHTFSPSSDNGTPDDPSDDVDLTTACANCHGPMTSFDIPKSDFDGDGRIEGVQTEVQGLLALLGNALPPDGPTAVVSRDYTAKQLRGLWNYKFVTNDGSSGIHNTQYAVGILQASIRDLTGRQVAAGGSVRVVPTNPANRRRLVASAAPVGGLREAAGKLAVEGQQPDIYGLYQNGPNPFNPETEIGYLVPEPVTVRISVYNTLGQQVRILVEAHHPAGEYSVTWDGRDASGDKVSAGLYIYTMKAGIFAGSGKMVLLP